MKHFAVIGHPISHSLSPLMHNTAFEILGLDYQYELLDIEPENLEKSVKHFREMNWGGINVTVPHKEVIIPFLDEVTPDALSIGAVNTVVNCDEKLIGYNTDIIGVEKSLQPYQQRIANQKCVIIGSGGVARSIAHVLITKLGIKAITFVALLPDQAKRLIDNYTNSKVEFRIIPSTDTTIENEIENYTLLVNATAIGMYPNILESPISNYKLLSNEHIVFDVIYRPLKTRLLTEAHKAGAITIDGLEMFIQQGAAAFLIWTKREMPLEQVRLVLEQKLTL